MLNPREITHFLRKKDRLHMWGEHGRWVRRSLSLTHTHSLNTPTLNILFLFKLSSLAVYPKHGEAVKPTHHSTALFLHRIKAAYWTYLHTSHHRGERERESETQTQRKKNKDWARDCQNESHIDRLRATWGEKDRQRDRCKQRERQRKSQKERQIERPRESAIEAEKDRAW